MCNWVGILYSVVNLCFGNVNHQVIKLVDVFMSIHWMHADNPALSFLARDSTKF